jgi:peroxiredoxin
MVELGQLEKHHAEFDSRGVNIVAASLDDLDETGKTQHQFRHLTILSDHDESLARAADVFGVHHSPTGATTVSPTTVLIAPGGKVRWIFRADRYINRLSPQELLTAIDEHLPAGR